jgi:acetamidase/formamidase
LIGPADKSVSAIDIRQLPPAHRTLGNNDSADDMKNIDLTRIHYLSGPFEIETAEPGDVLLVEIMDVQPFEDSPWGL